MNAARFQYRVWDPLNEHEQDAGSYREVNVRSAARAYGQRIIETGNSEAMSRHEVFVRDVLSHVLFSVVVAFEWDPSVTVSPERLVDEATGKSVERMPR